GVSLARFWKQPSQAAPAPPSAASPALAEEVPDNPRHRNSWGVPEQLPPLGAIKEKDWSYIRREVDVREELFFLREDPKERHNLAGDPAAQGTLQRMRAALGTLTAGPLLPQRFSP